MNSHMFLELRSIILRVAVVIEEGSSSLDASSGAVTYQYIRVSELSDSTRHDPLFNLLRLSHACGNRKAMKRTVKGDRFGVRRVKTTLSSLGLS